MPFRENAIPQELQIDVSTLHDQIWNIVYQYCEESGIDIKNYKVRSNVKHNTIINLFTRIYRNIFKSDTNLFNNQSSVLCYENIEQLAAVTFEFIEICSFFNVAWGIYGFQLMTGISDDTLMRWESQSATDGDRRRLELLKAVRTYNRNALLGLLKDSGVGAIAVANNDVETGLEWAKNNQQITQNNTVVYLPSERLDRLRLGQNPENP